MRILVTGGGGFIGSHLSRRLVAEGHEVRVFDDFSTGSRANLADVEAEVVEGDIRDQDALAAPMRGIEAVCHLAALPSVARSWDDPVASLHVNALGTANVLDTAIAAGAHTVIYSSSSSVYGDQTAARRSEDQPPRPISPYGHAKLMGEKLTLAHAQSGRLRGIALRYFNVFGPRQDSSSPYAAAIPRFIRHALAATSAQVDGDGLQSRDFTFVENVVDANLLALNGPAGGVALNCACGTAFTLLDLIDEISRLHGHPLQAHHCPARPADIRHSLADLALAESVLGYRPRVTFREGLQRTYEWYRQH
jgi:UDP-glucose 4-epimerase